MAGERELDVTLPSSGGAPVTLVAERYELRRELARGGQSQVFVAFDRQLGREVALKVPLATPDGKTNPDVEARFLREAQITARLDHPNIVTVHEIGRTPDGRLFCAQALVRGGEDGRVDTLGSALEFAATPQARLALLPRLLEVCNAVAFAHHAGVVHRDLKPDNVVLGRQGETIVLDWGLGRVLDGSTPDDVGQSSVPPRGTLDGQVFGTPLYMSPEQARGERSKVGRESDVWSLGVMLYELVSGETPFAAPSLVELLEQVRRAEVPPLMKVAPQTPRDLAAIAARALQPNPADRYPNAAAMAADLKAFLDGRTVGAHDYSALELIRLFISRNRAATLVGLISFAVLVVAVVALARSVASGRASLAEAYLEKARLAEAQLRWEEAAAWYAAARELSPREEAAAGLRAVWPRTQTQAQLLFGHVEAVKALAASADGKKLASGSSDHTIRLWDVEQGAVLRVLQGHTASVNALAMSADGSTLFSGGEDNVVLRWNLATGASERWLELPDAINALTLAPDGRALAIACEDSAVYLVALDAHERGEPFARHAHPVYTVAFSPDGRWLASGSWDAEIQVRQRDGALVATLTGHQGSVLSLAFHPRGPHLASAGRDGALRVWSTTTWREEQTLSAHTQKAYAVAWNDDGELLASASADGTSRVFTGFNRRPSPLASLGRDDELFTTLFLPGHDLLATGGRRGIVSLRRTVAARELGTNTQEIIALSELDDGRLAMQHNEGLALVAPTLDSWDVYPHDGGAPFAARSVMVTRSGRLAVGTVTNNVGFYDLVEQREVADGTAHQVLIEFVTLSPDGKLAVSSSKDGHAFVWNVETKSLLTELPVVRDGVFGVAFSSRGTLASASYDRKVRLYDTTTWQELRVLAGHEHGVRAVAFAPDGVTLASAGWDRSIRLWNAADGKLLAILRGHQDLITSVSFSPDGLRLASASHDGTIRLWDVVRGEEITRFIPEEGRANQVLFARDGKTLFYARQALHRIELVDREVPRSLQAVLDQTHLTMSGLVLRWEPQPASTR
ncbi:MAG: serine/threonine-protein kinase [Myxococcaceae bacterium]